MESLFSLRQGDYLRNFKEVTLYKKDVKHFCLNTSLAFPVVVHQRLRSDRICPETIKDREVNPEELQMKLLSNECLFVCFLFIMRRNSKGKSNKNMHTIIRAQAFFT